MTAAASLRVPRHIQMSERINSNTSNSQGGGTSRYYTGVSLEPEVSDYLNDLAGRMGMSRSWVINTIVHEYAKLMEKKQLKPLSSREAVIRL
jgi:hypothetical protein